jgi:UDP-3-O-[3-hydroxymyristoyl] N-acetylglucosamine deacetylase
LAGAPLLGLYRSYRGGHRLNYAALSALMSDPSAWRLVDMPAAARRARGHADVGAGLVAPAYSPEVS